jgi:uncharacterized protein
MNAAMRRAVVFGVLAVCVWLSFLALIRAYETAAVFGAGVTHWQTAPFDPQVFRHLSFATPDGLRLEAISADISRPGFWILFCGGSRSTIHASVYQEQFRLLRSRGYGVLAFDYRGFGRNPGTPSEPGVYVDALAAHRYLTTELQVPASRVIVAGRSLGSSVALEVAARVETAGVVLFSPIDSVPLTAARWYGAMLPIAPLAKNRFDNREKMTRVRVPVLVVHGSDDEWIPMSVARSLFELIPGPRLMVETSGGHNGAGFASPQDLWDALFRWWPPA